MVLKKPLAIISTEINKSSKYVRMLGFDNLALDRFICLPASV